jgi:hypothetical protein
MPTKHWDTTAKLVPVVSRQRKELVIIDTDIPDVIADFMLN